MLSTWKIYGTALAYVNAFQNNIKPFTIFCVCGGGHTQKIVKSLSLCQFLAFKVRRNTIE